MRFAGEVENGVKSSFGFPITAMVSGSGAGAGTGFEGSKDDIANRGTGSGGSASGETTESSNSSDTSDSSRPMMMLMLLILSCMGIEFLTFRRKTEE